MIDGGGEGQMDGLINDQTYGRTDLKMSLRALRVSDVCECKLVFERAAGWTLNIISLNYYTLKKLINLKKMLCCLNSTMPSSCPLPTKHYKGTEVEGSL